MTRAEAKQKIQDILTEATETESAVCYVTSVCADALELAIEALEQPERKTGHWVNNIHDLPICDQCGYMTPYDRAIDDYEYGNYCPNCGAKMRGEYDDN